jgi:hypothetical protein
MPSRRPKPPAAKEVRAGWIDALAASGHRTAPWPPAPTTPQRRALLAMRANAVKSLWLSKDLRRVERALPYYQARRSPDNPTLVRLTKQAKKYRRSVDALEARIVELARWAAYQGPDADGYHAPKFHLDDYEPEPKKEDEPTIFDVLSF